MKLLDMELSEIPEETPQQYFSESHYLRDPTLAKWYGASLEQQPLYKILKIPCIFKMDIITLVAVSLLVTERIVYHIITGLRHCKSKCSCSCDISKDAKDHDSKALALQKWRYPRIYRTIYAKELGAIFQADIMELYPLWYKIFDEYERNVLYRPKDYAFVCIDV
jgi:hypothetical protein